MQGVDLVELAYLPGGSTEEWLLSMLRSLSWIDQSCAAFAYEVDISDIAEPKIKSHVSLFGQCDERWVAQGHQFLMEHQGTWRLYRRRVTTARSTFGSDHPIIKKFLASTGISDGAVVFALDARGVGPVLSTQSTSTYRVNAKEQYAYKRLASHISAASRLRDLFGAAPTTDQADAILSPDGARVLHAANDAREADSRSLLHAFARRVDRARGSARRRDPMGALEAWTALLDGRWSMIDHFDSDGRRYCMFLRNDPRLERIQPLTSQQRQVMGLAALGVPNKLIAYEVGISEAGVSQALRAGMRRLGIRRRTDLVRVLGPLAEDLAKHDEAKGPSGQRTGRRRVSP